MKLNWGSGIAIFYGIFMIVLVTAVIKSTTYDNSLVSDQYYADDLKYQEHYDKLQHSQDLKKDLDISLDANFLTLQFPAEVGKINGKITFFCPSASKQDFSMKIQVDAEKTQIIELKEGLKPGLWRVKVDWQSEGKTYYKEESIVIKKA